MCVRSFIEIRKSSLIMFPLLFVLRLNNTFIPSAMSYIVLLQFFYKNGFGIKNQPTLVKERNQVKPNQN